MTSRHEGKTKATSASPVDRVTASPVRIAVLCVAVLMISVSGGILIGKIFDPFERKKEVQSVHALAVPAAVVAPTPSATTFVPESPFAYNDYPAPEEPRLTPEAEIAAREHMAREPATAELPSHAELPAWKRYAALAPDISGKPMIAIVIDDVGLSTQRIEDLNELPALLTLAFLPYAPSLQGKVEMARRNGNEVMLHLPMEPTDEDTDPGPDALLTELDDAEILERTIRNLDSFEGYVGVNNHMGSRFTADSRAMAIVMDEMSKRGLLFLDSKTTSASVGYRFAVERGMPSVKRDFFIDHVIDEAAILKQLAKVEAMALRSGVVIAIGHPHHETIGALRKWLPEAKKKGFLFVPVSAVTALTFKG